MSGLYGSMRTLMEEWGIWFEQ